MYKKSELKNTFRWGKFGLLLLILLILEGAYVLAEEKQAVSLLSVSPMEGSYIDNTPVFTLTFDKNVAYTEVRDHNRDLVSFLDGNGQAVLAHVEIADDEIYPSLKRVIEVQVLEPLSPGRYKLVVGAGIKAKNGTSTQDKYTFYYRVKEEEPEETEETESPEETEVPEERESPEETEEEKEKAPEEIKTPEETESSLEDKKTDSREGASDIDKDIGKESKAEESKSTQDKSNTDAKESKPESDSQAKPEREVSKESKKEPPERKEVPPRKKEKKEAEREASLILYEIQLVDQAEEGKGLPMNRVLSDQTGSMESSAGSGVIDRTWLLLGALLCLGFILKILNHKKNISKK